MFSVADSQEAFAIITESREEFESKINLMKVQDRNIYPQIIIIGGLTNIKSILIYLND